MAYYYVYTYMELVDGENIGTSEVGVYSSHAFNRAKEILKNDLKGRYPDSKVEIVILKSDEVSQEQYNSRFKKIDLTQE
ncbi:hypothetical protein [Sediminibacterium ginsengisoli]|uniref:Uncharacterized protein n=1 Tax=Sediminibacterium ginsengisoli TaxID=413434 RepID=A0A1T4MP38_9BACT|nr:hypothetical protein [Sediminibacterium ginsengisoli]SJZ68488.1 hypothetical protein SAMN04488132_103478 [Sediminibacterium ginsengisoli]